MNKYFTVDSFIVGSNSLLYGEFNNFVPPLYFSDFFPPGLQGGCFND